MGDRFWVGFEGVELLKGVGEDKPVWLYLRADLYEPGDHSTPVWTGDVGSLPPDANRPSYPGLPRGDAGWFADHLVRAQQVRNGTDWGTSNFSVGPVEVSPGQVLAVTVLMMPRVWFEKQKIPASEFDSWAAKVMGSLAGASVGGPGGSLLGGLFTDLVLGSGDHEVEVPCFNAVIEATHDLEYDDLRRFRNERSRRFGPQDNNVGLCEQIDSFYWLSVNNTGWSFGSSTPAEEAGPCSLEPRALRPHADHLAGGWGDTGDRVTDCVIVTVNLTDDSHANVYVLERHPGTEQISDSFLEVPITLDVIEPEFVRNVHDGPRCPARSVQPACPECSHFDNLALAFTMPKSMLLATILSGTHLGAQPAMESVQLREGQQIRDLGDDWFELWTGPPPFTERPAIRPLLTHLDPDEIVLLAGTPISWVLECTPQITLATYAELRNGKPCISRLRYVRRDEDGTIATDLLLTPLMRPVN